MSGSSSSLPQKFSVFLSFRGQETRRTFVSHLRCSLDGRGIATLEDESVLRGDEPDPSVIDRTIRESKVAVVLISENYAASPWCMQSLVKIMGFHLSGSVAVIPVFYDIDSSDVRKQSGKLWEPFSLHERENPADVQTWRETLSQLADIPSCQYSENWKGDAELIGKITDDIWGMLVDSKSSDLCGLVGMDRHMKVFFRLLELGLKDEVRLVHIWGREGIGKTEFARYLYEEVSHHFGKHIWLDNQEIRDHKGDNDSYLLRKMHYNHRRSIDGTLTPSILVVLDNVSFSSMSMEQRYVLETAFDSYGPGSRVIITTREKQDPWFFRRFRFLNYEFVGLEFSEALQLFCLHAFQQTHPFLGFEELSCRAVKLTDGNPSTIKKLGLRLSGRDKDELEVILSRYERSSDKGIINPDKIIFDSSSVTDFVSIQPSTMNYPEDLVGMNSRMQAVLGLLELGSKEEVRVIGIWGAGGIGKTTLASYTYEGVSQEFNTHVFLEIAEDHSSSFCLEEHFLTKAMTREAFAVRSSKDGLHAMKSGLQHQKVLLIVDGVDNSNVLEDVWKISTWFGFGSRIIVTTRDESLLVANGVKHLYEVKCLRFDEALQLFFQFATKQKSPSNRFKQLSVRAIKLVGFLPLALKVTGSLLNREDEKFWETILQSLEEKQDKGILQASVE